MLFWFLAKLQNVRKKQSSFHMKSYKINSRQVKKKDQANANLQN